MDAMETQNQMNRLKNYQFLFYLVRMCPVSALKGQQVTYLTVL